jgi:hypothetical protein
LSGNGGRDQGRKVQSATREQRRGEGAVRDRRKEKVRVDVQRGVGALEDKFGMLGLYRGRERAGNSLQRRHGNSCSWSWDCSVL